MMVVGGDDDNDDDDDGAGCATAPCSGGDVGDSCFVS